MVAQVIKYGRYSTAGALLAVALLGTAAFAAGFSASPLLTVSVAFIGGAAAGAFAAGKSVE